MEYLSIIAAILLIDLLALIGPGPNFVLLTSAAVSQSRRHALAMALGIATGSLFWATAAALGLSAIFDALPLLGLALKVFGIAYLLYLGVKLLRSKGFTPAAARSANPMTQRRCIGRGLMVNLTNPKSAAYYASVFAAFLTPDLPVWVLIVIVAAIALMSLLWHSFLAVALSTPRVQAAYISGAKWCDRLCGAVLVLLGLRLAWDSR